MSEKVENQTEEKEITTVSDDELTGLLAQSQKLQEKENEGEGIKADYLILAKSGTKALSKLNKDLYIEGLRQGDIFIQKDKKILGDRIKVVPLAFITLYQEKESVAQDAKFFGILSKEQAVTYPVAGGSYFNRQLPNGHIAVPVNWCCVEVLGHREIEHAVIAFKSTGSRIWKALKEDCKSRSGSSASLIYEIFEEAYNNDKFSWTDFGFQYVGSLLETDKNEAVYCLKKSNAIRETIANNTFIPPRSLEYARPVAQIADASDIEDASDDDMDFAGF